MNSKGTVEHAPIKSSKSCADIRSFEKNTLKINKGLNNT